MNRGDLQFLGRPTKHASNGKLVIWIKDKTRFKGTGGPTRCRLKPSGRYNIYSQVQSRPEKKSV